MSTRQEITKENDMEQQTKLENIKEHSLKQQTMLENIKERNKVNSCDYI